MKHPPSRFAAPPSLAFGGRGAHPEAWQSQFLGCPEGFAALADRAGAFHAMRVVCRAMDN